MKRDNHESDPQVQSPVFALHSMIKSDKNRGDFTCPDPFYFPPKEKKMKIRVALLVVFVLFAAAVAAWPGLAKTVGRPPADIASPQVFSSPINGGCYIAGPDQCRLHVDPFTVNIAPGQRLVALRLQANGVTIYDFTTDVSNPPPASGTTYSPSLVMQDFAAECGKTYTMNILGRDSGDSNFLNMGQTASFTCPAGVP